MIPVYRPIITGSDKKSVIEAIESGWVSSKGPKVDEFERKFKAYTGVSQATSVSNGTVALHLALLALGIKAGDEVIVPAFTYVASVNTIIQVGAVPVFVDSDEYTGQMLVGEVIKKITTKTKAIMAVHLYGHAVDIVNLCKVARDNSLYVIEDCAEALGTFFATKHVGTFGDIGTFSFFGNKTITTGEGGMVISNNSQIIDRVKKLKSQSLSTFREYWHDELGYNYRLTNMQAALGSSQLNRLDEIIAAKTNLFKKYKKELSDLPVSMLEGIKGQTSSYWMCSIVVENESIRDALRKKLLKKNIETRPFFPLVSEFSYIDDCNEYPNAKRLSSRGINLPSSPDLTDIEFSQIINAIKEFFGEIA